MYINFMAYLNFIVVLKYLETITEIPGTGLRVSPTCILLDHIYNSFVFLISCSC